MLLTVTTSTSSNASVFSGFISFLDRYQENITTVIAVISLVLTIGQLLYTCYRRRVNFSIELQAYQSTLVHVTDDPAHPEKDNHVFFLTIINYSSSPVVLTKFYIYDEAGNKYLCRLRNTWVGEAYYPKFPETDIPRTDRKLSPDFPICLGAEQARNESIVFKIPKDTKIFTENSFSFEVHNITKVKSFTLSLPVGSPGPLSV